jgi:aminopeptidase N
MIVALTPLRRRLAATATAGLAAIAMVAGCAPNEPEPTQNTAGAANFQPGSDGLGDPYTPKAGNGGYDVTSYALDLRYDPKTGVLSGTAAIKATATANLSRFNLDLRALKTDKVTVNGAAAGAEAAGDELEITPSAGLPKASTFDIAIDYGGVPKPYQDAFGGGEVGFLATDDGAVAIGEPDVAASWFPVNDHPRDKATYTVDIEVPDGLAALSNGVLKGKASARGWTTWSWAVNHPMTPYLATVVIGKYRVRESIHDGLPMVTAVHATLPASIDPQLARSGEVVDFLETKFGPYPFDAIGGIAIAEEEIRFALENQTRPLYGPTFFRNGGDATWVIVHELAHQWFGDSVSLHDWKDLWLNEGFASYAEWLWNSDHGGPTPQNTFDSHYAEPTSELWTIPPGAPPANDLFNGSVYTRGAMTLHALRRTVGDAAFFTILKAWAAEQKDRNPTTADFIALAERVSGRQLDQLFQDWLYGTVRPPRP